MTKYPVHDTVFGDVGTSEGAKKAAATRKQRGGQQIEPGEAARYRSQEQADRNRAKARSLGRFRRKSR
jgi:hypothetical protein